MRRMYDSVNPYAIPTTADMVAGYIDGDLYRWTDAAWDRFPAAVKVRIARRVTTNDGHVLDVEPNIPTVWPPDHRVVEWVLMRRASGADPTIYCNQLSHWRLIQELFRTADVAQPHYWVARYDNVAEIPSGAVAKQYANSTLTGRQYDLSIVADFWPGVDRGDHMVSESLEQRFLQGMAGVRSAGDLYAMLSEIHDNVAALVSRVSALEQQLGTLVGSGIHLAASGEIIVKPQ